MGGSKSREEDTENDSGSSSTARSGAEDSEDLESNSDIASNCHGSQLEEMDRTVVRLREKLEGVRDDKDAARAYLKGCRSRMEEAQREFERAQCELEGAHRKVEEVHRELGEARQARILWEATHTAESSQRAWPTRSHSPRPRKVQRHGPESSTTFASGSNTQS